MTKLVFLFLEVLEQINYFQVKLKFDERLIIPEKTKRKAKFNRAEKVFWKENLKYIWLVIQIFLFIW